MKLLRYGSVGPQVELLQLTDRQVGEIYRKRIRKDFPPDEIKPLAMIRKALAGGRYACYGAFDGGQIIGFAIVSHRIFGTASRYVQLVCFQISEEYRRQGIGRKLFSMACEETRRLGAEKLYISAHSSKESQAAYRALGCTPAEEVNEELAAAEPFDVQMEYRL